MSEFRIMDSNYFFDRTKTVTPSSEDPNFPVTNLLNHIRGKVWRSTGTYVITTTNRKLDFNIGGGAVVATLTTGTYTPTTLCAEIVTRLNAAAAGTYTATFSANTGKFTLTKSTGTFTLLWNTGTNTANSVGPSIGFPTASNSTGSLTYTGSLVAIHTEESIIIDLGAATNIDSFALLFDPTAGMNLSGSAVVKIQANSSNAWTAPTIDQAITLSTAFDWSTYFFSSSQSYRYWRIKIVDPTNTDLYVEIGKIFLSLATQLTYGPEIGFTQGLEDQSQGLRNDYGHEYYDIYPSRQRYLFSHKLMSETDVQTLYNIYQTVGKHTPICLSLDSTGSVFSSNRFFCYGRFAKPFSVKNVFYTSFDQDIEFLEGM